MTMTDEEMKVVAGLRSDIAAGPKGKNWWLSWIVKMDAAADLIECNAEARREALEKAATVCDEYSKDHGTGMFDRHSAACADAIRALMEEQDDD